MSKYAILTDALRDRPGSHWRVTFAELEHILQKPLPKSAYNYPAWWSNTPSNNTMTPAWLAAGWKTAEVDVPGRKVTFRKVRAAARGAIVAEDNTAGYEAGLLVALDADHLQNLQALADESGEPPEQTAARLLGRALEAASPALRVRRAKAGLTARAHLPNIDLEALVAEAKGQH